MAIIQKIVYTHPDEALPIIAKAISPRTTTSESKGLSFHDLDTAEVKVRRNKGFGDVPGWTVGGFRKKLDGHVREKALYVDQQQRQHSQGTSRSSSTTTVHSNHGYDHGCMSTSTSAATLLNDPQEPNPFSFHVDHIPIPSASLQALPTRIPSSYLPNSRQDLMRLMPPHLRTTQVIMDMHAGSEIPKIVRAVPGCAGLQMVMLDSVQIGTGVQLPPSIHKFADHPKDKAEPSHVLTIPPGHVPGFKEHFTRSPTTSPDIGTLCLTPEGLKDWGGTFWVYHVHVGDCLVMPPDCMYAAFTLPPPTSNSTNPSPSSQRHDSTDTQSSRSNSTSKSQPTSTLNLAVEMLQTKVTTLEHWYTTALSRDRWSLKPEPQRNKECIRRVMESWQESLAHIDLPDGTYTNPHADSPSPAQHPKEDSTHQHVREAQVQSGNPSVEEIYECIPPTNITTLALATWLAEKYARLLKVFHDIVWDESTGNNEDDDIHLTNGPVSMTGSASGGEIEAIDHADVVAERFKDKIKNGTNGSSPNSDHSSHSISGSNPIHSSARRPSPAAVVSHASPHAHSLSRFLTAQDYLRCSFCHSFVFTRGLSCLQCFSSYSSLGIKNSVKAIEEKKKGLSRADIMLGPGSYVLCTSCYAYGRSCPHSLMTLFQVDDGTNGRTKARESLDRCLRTYDVLKSRILKKDSTFQCIFPPQFVNYFTLPSTAIPTHTPFALTLRLHHERSHPQKVSCHQCRCSKSLGHVITCTSCSRLTDNRISNRIYCASCLFYRYGELLYNGRISRNWQCPHCDGNRCTNVQCFKRLKGQAFLPAVREEKLEPHLPKVYHTMWIADKRNVGSLVDVKSVRKGVVAIKAVDEEAIQEAERTLKGRAGNFGARGGGKAAATGQANTTATPAGQPTNSMSTTGTNSIQSVDSLAVPNGTMDSTKTTGSVSGMLNNADLSLTPPPFPPGQTSPMATNNLAPPAYSVQSPVPHMSRTKRPSIASVPVMDNERMARAAQSERRSKLEHDQDESITNARSRSSSPELTDKVHFKVRKTSRSGAPTIPPPHMNNSWPEHEPPRKKMRSGASSHNGSPGSIPVQSMHSPPSPGLTGLREYLAAKGFGKTLLTLDGDMDHAYRHVKRRSELAGAVFVQEVISRIPVLLPTTQAPAPRYQQPTIKQEYPPENDARRKYPMDRRLYPPNNSSRHPSARSSSPSEPPLSANPDSDYAPHVRYRHQQFVPRHHGDIGHAPGGSAQGQNHLPAPERSPKRSPDVSYGYTQVTTPHEHAMQSQAQHYAKRHGHMPPTVNTTPISAVRMSDHPTSASTSGMHDMGMDMYPRMSQWPGRSKRMEYEHVPTHVVYDSGDVSRHARPSVIRHHVQHLRSSSPPRVDFPQPHMQPPVSPGTAGGPSSHGHQHYESSSQHHRRRASTNSSNVRKFHFLQEEDTGMNERGELMPTERQSYGNSHLGNGMQNVG